MINASRVKKLLGAAATLGSGSILKAIGKIAPGIGSFVSGAYTAGYAADQIADFLRERLTTPEQKRNVSQLKGRAEAGVARPDERAELVSNEQRMAPFEAGAGIAKLAGQAGAGLSTARSAAASQQAELEQQQALIQQQQQKQQQQQEEAAFRRERELERDVDNRKYRQSTEQREASAESRAAEKHKMAMEKAQQPKAQASKPKSPSKAEGANEKLPETFLETIRWLDENINRRPR